MNPLDLGKRAILEHQVLAHSARFANALRTANIAHHGSV